MKLGIFGATGVVGITLIDLLNEKNTQFDKLYLFASTSGRHITVQGKIYTVQKLDNKRIDIDVAIFCTPSSVSKQCCMQYLDSNCIIIDNSSAFRMQSPLIIPEINGGNIKQLVRRFGNIISNPNCSTIILAMVLAPLHAVNPIKKVIVSTYQAASGAGLKAMNELSNQAKDYTFGNEYKTDVMGKQYLWNVFSHNSPISENGYNEEENKIINEIDKIFNNAFDITATCIRVPVLRAHCESVHIEFMEDWCNISNEEKITCNKENDYNNNSNYVKGENAIRTILENTNGVSVLDDRKNNQFPEPIIASDKDDIFVGRIRHDKDIFNNNCYQMFISGDQLRKGAALNALQIYELLLED